MNRQTGKKKEKTPADQQAENLISVSTKTVVERRDDSERRGT